MGYQDRSPYRSAEKRTSFSGLSVQVPETPPPRPQSVATSPFHRLTTPSRTGSPGGSVLSPSSSFSYRPGLDRPDSPGQYDIQRMGLWTPQSRRVGPMAGPDPYNVKRDSAFDFTLKRSQAWGTGSPVKRDEWLTGSPSFVQSRYPNVTALRVTSPLKRHPSITSPMRSRTQKRLAGLRPLDMRSIHSGSSFGRFPKRGLSMSGNITNKDVFTR